MQFSTTGLLSSCGLREGRKSIFRAFASFAAVRKEKFTSSCNTFVIYGRDTFICRASSVCETPSSFIRSKICRINADPILSMFIGFRFRVASFEFLVSRSRTVVVFSRVEVEMGRGGFYLDKVFYRLIYSIIGTLQSNLPQFHSQTPTHNSNS